MTRPWIVAAVLLSGAHPASAWAPDAQARQVLGRGQAFAEVGPTPGGGIIRGAIDIAAPPARVWAVMNDCAVTARLITNLVSCRTLQADAGHTWEIREQVTRGNFFVPTLHNVLRLDYQPFSRIAFRKAGGDLAFEEGEWRLEPLGGGTGTRVVYVNRLGVHILAPAILVRAALKRDTAKALVNLRRECLAAQTRDGA